MSVIEKLLSRLPPFTRSYAALLGTMLLARVALVALGAGPVIRSQGLALSWITLAVLALAGWGALVLAGRIGFSERWAEVRSRRRWYALAAATGLVYGLLSASGDVGDWASAGGDAGHRAVFGTVDVHQRFPASVPFYWYGGVFLEILLRLIGLTVLTWLLRLVLDRGRADPTRSFWVANVVVSLYEPWPFMAHELQAAPAAAGPSIILDHLLGKLFLANLFTGFLYRRTGIWIAVVFRTSMYLVWHVAYGGFRPYWLDLLAH